MIKRLILLLMAAVVVGCAKQPCTELNDGQMNQAWTFWTETDTNRLTVDLPHDAQQMAPRDAEVPGGHNTGFVSGDVYHYSKTFTAPEDWEQKHITFEFEGVYRNARVMINGHEAGGAAYGYLPFRVVADEWLHEGENTLEVVADNSEQPNSRWYSGGGIYRPMHVLVQDKEAYLEDIRIKTLSVDPARIQIEVAHQGGSVSTQVMLNGKRVAEGQGSDCILDIPGAQLWDAEHPILYQAVIKLEKEGKKVETCTVDFGIRLLAWNAEEGLLVNGQPTLLRGGCIHHDNGILGACEYDDAAMRRIARLKEYGFNAIRSAHNPCSEAVLRACDRLGMYVMDEMWDMWYTSKTAHDYSHQWKENWQNDVKAVIRKDYCHPSVVMYSIGNEVGEPHNAEGYGYEKQVVDLIHEQDDTRPTTAGFNLMIMMLATMDIDIYAPSARRQPQQITSEQYNQMLAMQGEQMMQAVMAPQIDLVADPACDLLDIAGYNYGQMRYGMDAQTHPNRILVGSETMPYHIASNWEKVEQYPQLIGDFMWTAWDYLGECGIGAWYHSESDMPSFSKPYPWVLADAGALDLLGNPNAEALWAKAVWQKDDKPYLAVCPIRPGHLIKAMWRGTNAIPSWSWPGEEGKPTQVEVYTSAPKVELYLNGQLLGEQATTECHAVFDVTYEPGTLKAVSISADGKQQEAILESATGAMHIAARTEKDRYKAGELIYIDVDLEGENGQVVSNCDRQLTVKAEGARLLGFGSARRMTEERFLDGCYTTQDGHAQAILLAGEPGKAVLTIAGVDLPECRLEIGVGK